MRENMHKKRVFGELELAILKIFKGQDRMTVRDVLMALKGDDKYTTIMTVMNRLTEKKMLFREKIGQQYEYWLNSSNQPSSPSLLERLKQKIFGGNSASMASYLIESGDISDEELLEMEKLIENIRKSRKQS
jgi:predicted transcriptional regulator